MINYTYIFTQERVALEGHDPDLDIKATSTVVAITPQAEMPEGEWESSLSAAKRRVREALVKQAQMKRDAANKFLAENDPLAGADGGEE